MTVARVNHTVEERYNARANADAKRRRLVELRAELKRLEDLREWTSLQTRYDVEWLERYDALQCVRDQLELHKQVVALESAHILEKKKFADRELKVKFMSPTSPS